MGPYNTGIFTATWRSSAHQLLSSGPGGVFVGNSCENNYLTIRYAADDTITFTDGTGLVNTGVGYVPDVPQSYTLVLDMDGRVFSLMIDGIPVGTDRPFDSTCPAVSLDFIEWYISSGTGTHSLDDIRIVRGAPAPPEPDFDGDGVPDIVDNCPTVPNPSQADFDEDGVGDACDNCPKSIGLSSDQTDDNNNGLGDACDGGSSVALTCLTPPCPTTTIQAGLPAFFDVTVTNRTGNTITTIRPDCYNVLFQLTGPGGVIEPSCRLRAPYRIGEPDNPTISDVITIANDASYPLTCDLSEQYPAATLPADLTSGTLRAYYWNYIQDPDVVPNQDITTPAGCKSLTGYPPDESDSGTPCTNLFMGIIQSLPTQVNISNNTNVSHGTLTLQADKHSVGLGKNPGSTKTPIVGMDTWVFDKKKGSCAAGYGISWQNYPAIVLNCTSVIPGPIPTDANGQAQYNLPVGDYIVIGEYDKVDPTIYPGVSVGAINDGSNVRKYVQVIERADKKTLPATYQVLTGSELLVIQPEYMEWSSTTELYPFVFQSIGDWGVTTAVTPPSGFVADYPALSTEVNTEIKAIQFTVTDVGSDWVSTKVKYTIKHKGKEVKIDSKVGIKLSPELAKIKKKSIFGDEPPPEGKKK